MSVDLRPEVRRTVGRLLDRFHVLFLTLGAVATLASLYRVTLIGWHPGAVTTVPYFLGVLIVLLLRRRLSVGVAVGLMVAIATIRAAVGLLTLGPDATSFVILVTTSAVVAAVFGIRTGVAFLAGVSVMSAVIATLICSGIVKLAHSTDPLVREPQTWVYQVAGLAVYSAVILIVEWDLQKHLTDSLNAVSIQADKLRKNEERYRLLADNMREVLFLLDAEERIRFVSPSVERVCGYTVEEFKELRTEDVFAPGEGKRASEAFSKLLTLAANSDFEAPAMEFEFRRKDGSTFWGEFTPTFPTDEQGRVIGAQGLLADISDRKELERKQEALELELRQAEKLQAIGELAGGIAHDFNNQLTPIMVHADLLARDLVEPESVRTHARKIMNPARNAADLTGKLLAFARKGSFEHRPVDVHDVINEVAEILVHGIDRRIEVKRHYEAASAVIEGDRTQIQNVLLNLALNARDAMPNGGEIIFKTRILKNRGEDSSPSNSRLLIQVEDTGEGMGEAVRERVFEPFFTTKAQGKGTGMGLAAAYGTVGRHGGRIEVASVVGEGTMVSITLPLTTASTGIRVDSFADSTAAGVGRVLVLDDDDNVRSALTDLLENLGCSVVAFGRAPEAINCYGESWSDFDLVVLDLVLPEMSGREVLAAIQEINQEVRVLLVSGYTADDKIRELLQSDAIEFLEKPFLLADLAESLTRLKSPR